MNNKEISRIVQSDPRARRIFRGVYPRDQLPPSTTPNSAYIINTDHSRGPGEHWVCVWFDSQGGAEYFDSFGLPPTLNAIQRFISDNSIKSLKYNQRLCQSLVSSACGLYIIYYVLMKSRGASLRRLQQPFQPYNLRGNDNKVRTLVSNLLSAPQAMIYKRTHRGKVNHNFNLQSRWRS